MWNYRSHSFRTGTHAQRSSKGICRYNHSICCWRCGEVFFLIWKGGVVVNLNLNYSNFHLVFRIYMATSPNYLLQSNKIYFRRKKENVRHLCVLDKIIPNQFAFKHCSRAIIFAARLHSTWMLCFSQHFILSKLCSLDAHKRSCSNPSNTLNLSYWVYFIFIPLLSFLCVN